MFLNLTENIHNQFISVYDWADEMKTTMYRRAEHQAQTLQTAIGNFSNNFNQNVQNTKNKVASFVYDHRKVIFFFACSSASACFSPQLFICTLVLTTVVRVQTAHQLKGLADYYLKTRRNPYHLHPEYKYCVTPVEATLGTVAGINSVILGTFYLTNSVMLSLLPALGGIAAGSAVAKWGMNVSHFLK